MKNYYTIKCFIQIFLVSMTGLLIAACSQNTEQQGIAKKTTQTILPQVTILANLPDSSKPQVTLLAEKPKPIIKLNPKPGKFHSFVDSLTRIPLAPEVQGTGFFTTYTTDNGLIADAVSCGIMDKKGTIWFGTPGGGVSKFDGKKFISYTTAQGLAHDVVRSIFEDSKGNLWFGTLGGGTSKYDGQTFTTYTTKQGLAGNDVSAIIEDKVGNLWFGTGSGGVSKYDGKEFVNYTTAEGLALNRIWNILEDKAGNLWFSTDGAGVSKYNGQTFTTYTTTQGLASDDVFSILEDKIGNLWFGTMGGGLSKYDGKIFTTYTAKQGLASNRIISCLEDKAGNLWFGTLGGGMSMYDGQTFITYTTKQGLANNGVSSIIEDKAGNLWFGTLGGGVSKYSGKSLTSFTTAQGLGNNIVSSILEDKAGNLWFGTVYGGVSKYDGNSLATYTTDQGLANDNVMRSLTDKAGNLWFSTDGAGVCKYDGQTFTTYTAKQGLASNNVFSLLEDSMGNLWFGTIDGGVSKYDGQTFTTYTTTQGLASNDVLSILEDSKGNLWFGTVDGGVSKYDGQTFTTYTTTQGLANKSVNHMLEDKAGNLWFATDRGLSVIPQKKLVKENNKSTENEHLHKSLFTTFTTEDGLPNNTIVRILENNDGKLIIGTDLGIAVLNKGIRSFDIAGEVELYNSATGYPIKTLYTLFLDSKGIIWMGTGSDKTGLIRFDQKVVHKNHNVPVIVLQNVKINNEILSWSTLLSSKSEKHSQILDSLATPASITEEVTAFGRVLRDSERENLQNKFTDVQFDNIAPWYSIPQNLILPYHHNNIAFEFNAIETSRNFMVKYQYMLEGYNEGWSPLTSNTSAIFGNIYEGDYTFKVKALSPEGVWSKPVTYTFIVLPPWWRTPWAYGLYCLAMLGLVWRGRQAIVNRERYKAEQRLRLLQAEQLHQIDKLKSRFFTNVSHEFRTPLTLILGPLDKLLTGQVEPSQISYQYRIMQRNAQKLLQLINQLLDFSKLEAGSMRFQPSSGNLLQHVKALTFSFSYLAESQAIELSFYSPYSHLQTHFDADLLDKMLGNLLSNALKFTPPGGSVKVQLTLDPAPGLRSTSLVHTMLLLQVHDTGPGIPTDQLEKIFERFYQGDTIHASQGSGIGLALVKELAELQGGNISVQSKVGSGTSFTLQLPLNDCQVAHKSADQFQAFPNSLPANDSPLSKPVHTQPEEDEGHPLLLVVEDNAEVRQFLQESLQTDYRVLEAANGQEALQLGRQLIPDLVITDWMMPVMDGMALCKQLKTDELTSHIPVVMLTAKASQESRLEGLETGADDYLAKPYSLLELKARVKNLIEQRKKLRQRFSREVKLQPKDIAITSADEVFLKRVIALIETHMSDTDFSVERLVVEIGMSRVQLHRKLKALTDESTSEFIRTIRLKRAASLLEQGYGNVSEVMYQVGFNSVSYFASNFKQRYGVNPSEYPLDHHKSKPNT